MNKDLYIMKQQKVLKDINNSFVQANSQTNPNKTKPNDECYTSMQDILTELAPWAGLGKFQDKNIICPCDWDIVEGENIYSIRINYNDFGVDVIGNDVQKVEVEYDLWNEDASTTTIKLKEDEIDEFLRNKLTCNFVRTFTQNARTWGIKSITASGYNPATGKGVKFQDVDYSKYDVCVTNPPFSLYSEFMNCIVDKINFICLAPFLNRLGPTGFYGMYKKCYLGWGCLNHVSNNNMHLKFMNPTSENNYNVKEVACDWITSFPEAQEDRNQQLKDRKSGIDYELYKDDFITIDGLHMLDGGLVIKVPSRQFPDNYNGWMFAAINALGEFNHNSYEWYVTNKLEKFLKDINKHLFVNDKLDLSIQSKKQFGGILFRKKPKRVAKKLLLLF